MKEVKAPISGSVWKITVSEGEQIEVDQDIAILESMKMEIPIQAEMLGTVKQIKVFEGDSIEEGDVIVVIE